MCALLTCTCEENNQMQNPYQNCTAYIETEIKNPLHSGIVIAILCACSNMGDISSYFIYLSRVSYKNAYRCASVVPVISNEFC